MLVVRGKSALPAEELLRIAMGKRIVLLDPQKVGSVEELELAYALAKRSIGEGRAIGKSLETEFVLWLAGKRDIKRAFEEVGWKRGEFIAVSFGMTRRALVKALGGLKGRGKWRGGAPAFSLGLEKEASVEEIEKISLSRIL